MTAAPPEVTCPRYPLELEEEEESLLRPRIAEAAARPGVHWDEASTDEEGSGGGGGV